MDLKHSIVCVYLPHLRCYQQIASEERCILTARILHKIHFEGIAHSFIQGIVRCAYVQPEIPYVGTPSGHILKHLVAVGNGVLDL